MKYRIDVIDTWGRRVASFDEAPLLEAVRTTPDQADRITGLLPSGIGALGHGYALRVYVDEALFCEARVTDIQPQWGDTRKLILEHYVPFHEVVELQAERSANEGNTVVSRVYVNREVSVIVRDAIDRALGRVHYYVAHEVYPEGAQREHAKFFARKTPENELELGGIAFGQWLESSRIDATGAYAKDGDTLAGLVVDGATWPDLRLMLIDAEETALNSHAVARHPETADWTAAQYDASGYKLKADRAKAFLQALIDTKGIDFIELNPHRDSTGAFDDRVDAYGRYLGWVYGGGECFNAAMVEQGHAEVYLWADGAYHVPEMALKDYFSYAGPHSDSIEASDVTLGAYDVGAGLFEILATLAYAANGYVFSVDEELGVAFRKVLRPDRVYFFDPTQHAVMLGSRQDELVNRLYFSGNPITSTFENTYYDSPGIDAYGVHAAALDLFAVTLAGDADRIAAGLLADVAYPEPLGALVFLHGNAEVRVGDLVELRGAQLRRLEPELSGEWGGRFSGRIAGRVREVCHRFFGARVETTVRLGSPLRSVASPLGYLVRSQPTASDLYQFRLDEAAIGLDAGFHLD